MHNNIFRFTSLHKLSIAVVGLVLTLGMVGEQTKPVFSEQVRTSNVLVPDNQDSVGTTLLTRLREVREERNQRWVASQASDDIKIIPKTKIVAIANQKSAKETVTAPRANFPRQDGVYLYGQSLQPNQLGQGYIVFEKRQDMVKGALFMPRSEFSCFQGTLDKSGELAMTVMGSPDEGGLAQVSTNNRLPKINNDEPTNYAYSVALQDYHQLKSVSANDRRILQMCNQPAEEYRKLVK